MDVSRSDDALNLMEIWRAILKYRMLVLGVAFAITVVSVAGSYLIQPMYRADVLLAASQSQSESPLGDLAGQYGGLASLAGINLGGAQGQSMNEAIEIIRSRSFTEKFIESENLLPTLFPDRWDAQNKLWRASGKESGPPSSWDAFKKLNSVRSIARDTKTNFVKLSIEWHVPEIAATWANKMVAMLNEHLRTRSIEEAERSIAYLQAQLDQTNVMERREMFARLMENETRKIVLAKSRPEYAVRILDSAVVPKERVRPNRPVIAISALIFGLLLGAVAAVIRKSVAE